MKKYTAYERASGCMKKNNMADASDKASAKPRNRQWTQTELKYLALVLADEKHEFGYKLDTLALKKTVNKTVFENIKKAFKERMSSQELKEENEREHRGYKSKWDLPHLRVDVERLRVKFKWMKGQWRKYTDRKAKTWVKKSKMRDFSHFRLVTD